MRITASRVRASSRSASRHFMYAPDFERVRIVQLAITKFTARFPLASALMGIESADNHMRETHIFDATSLRSATIYFLNGLERFILIPSILETRQLSNM